MKNNKNIKIFDIMIISGYLAARIRLRRQILIRYKKCVNFVQIAGINATLYMLHASIYNDNALLFMNTLKQEKPLISVIIPCYKAERHIGNCLDRITEQSYTNLEVIVVVDGDYDRTKEIASRYDVKQIVNPDNLGISAARNAGLKMATGEYVHFMDVDDEINPDYYMKMIEAAGEDNPDVICSGFRHCRVPYKTQIFRKRRIFKSDRQRLKATWVGKLGYVWRYIFKRQLLLDHDLYFEVGRYVEDWYVSVRALYYADVVVSAPGAIYKYNYTPNSVLTTKDPGHKLNLKRDRNHAIDEIKAFAKEHEIRIPAMSFGTGMIEYFSRKMYYKTLLSLRVL